MMGMGLLAGVQTALENDPNWTEIVSCVAAVLAVVVTVVIFWFRRKKG